jgi:hypothetical protein
MSCRNSACDLVELFRCRQGGLTIAGLAMAAPRGGATGGRGRASHFRLAHRPPVVGFTAPAAHFARPSFSGGHPSFRPNIERSFSHPNFHGNIAHTYSRPAFRGTAHPMFRRNIAHSVVGRNELLETRRHLTLKEQKAKLTVLGTNHNRNRTTTGSLAQTCAAPPVGMTVGQPAKSTKRCIRRMPSGRCSRRSRRR